MLRQLSRVASRAAAAQQSALLCAQLQQVPLWHELLQGTRHQASAGCSPKCSRAATQVMQSQWQQQSWRAYQAGYEQSRRRNQKGITDGAMYLGAVVLAMIGLSYASVPLYRAFCQATGYGGAVGQARNVEAKLKAREEQPNPTLEQKCAQREIRVWFSSDVADDMPWTFVPTQQYVTVHPGESTLAFFTAHNKSTDRAITGVSTYNVVPDQAAYYFNKIQCFCFEEQRLRPGEVVDMPVFFYIDPELVEDRHCRNVHDITLSYCFFKVEEDADALIDDSSSSGVKLHGHADLPHSITDKLGLPAPRATAPSVAAVAAPVVAAGSS